MIPIGFDEISTKAIACPTDLGWKFIGCVIWHGYRRFGAATAWGDLERRTGKYFQTVGNYHGANSVARTLGGMTVAPNGFGTRPTRDGYDFHRECEAVFGPCRRLPPGRGVERWTERRTPAATSQRQRVIFIERPGAKVRTPGWVISDVVPRTFLANARIRVHGPPRRVYAGTRHATFRR